MEEYLRKNLLRNENAPLAKINSFAFVILVLAIVFITYQIIGGMFTYLIIGSDDFANAKTLNTTRFIVTAGQFMMILVPVVVLNMLRGDTGKVGFNLNKPDWKITLLAIIGIIAAQPFLQYFVVIQNKIIFALPIGENVLNEMKRLYESLESTTLKLVLSYSIPEFIVVVIVIAVTPAICEEFLFRGVVLGNLRESFNPVKASIITGLIFAAYHFHPFNFLALFVLGIYLSIITYWGGSVLTAIAAHFVNNFISAYAVFVSGKDFMSESEITGSDLLNYGMLAFGSLLIFIAIIFLMNLVYKRKTGKNIYV